MHEERIHGQHDRVDGVCATCRRDTALGPCAGPLAEEIASYDRQIAHLMTLRRRALEAHGIE